MHFIVDRHKNKMMASTSDIIHEDNKSNHSPPNDGTNDKQMARNDFH